MTYEKTIFQIESFLGVHYFQLFFYAKQRKEVPTFILYRCFNRYVYYIVTSIE